MFRPRVIPVLLLKNKGLVKTRKFGKSKYIGDPINAVRVFNDLEADELVFLDITASLEKRTVSVDLIRKIGDEAFMPFAVGGGIAAVDDIGALLNAGAEKVVINTAAVSDSTFIRRAADLFGNQSIIASVDVKKNVWGNYKVYTMSGQKVISKQPVQVAIEMAEAGAGEILLNAMDRDGEMCGYDLELVRHISDAVDIPVIACGGAGCLDDIVGVVKQGGASAAAAGSLFVFHGPRRAVLINYPDRTELIDHF
ncbi:MAG: AglZ/HisF2 family acetamidino modification protein [Bacteroidetes bacterium]|nr:AglZ/HisF2 family acetamidino modification protein [Bacteroidota bacterium]